MMSLALLLVTLPVLGSAPAETEYKTGKEVEAEAKEALSSLLDYLGDSDKKLKEAIKEREGAAQKVKRLKDLGEAPNSLREATRVLEQRKKAVVTRQSELVVGMLPADSYDKLRPGIKKVGVIFQYEPKEKAEKARQLAGHFSGLIQFADTKYREALKSIDDQAADLKKYQAALSEATDDADKEKIKKKLADAKAKQESASKSAAQLRKAYVGRLVWELSDGSGVKPTRTHRFQFEKR
jgi:predicted  nucleic acid-binding Zn-ribbon protein